MASLAYREAEGNELLQFLYEHPEAELAVDTETTGLKVATGDSICIGISIATVIDGVGYAHYFPTAHSSFSSFNVSPSTVEKLGYVLTQQGRLLIFANVIFDTLSLDTVGIHVDGVPELVDICSMAHFCDENYPKNKGVDSLSLYYLGESGKIKDPFVEKEKKTGNQNITPEQMWDYAVMDAVSTWRVWDQLRQHPVWMALPDGLWPEKRKLIRVLIQMRRRGVAIDVETATAMERIGTKKMAELKAELGMNPASHKDMQALLIDTLGLPILKTSKKTAAPSFDKEVMEEYDLILERMDRKEAVLIRDYRGWQKAVTASYRPFLELLDSDGRLRCSYKLHGTVTGRFSCSEPNLQQIPKASEKPWNGKVKECFIARPGYVLMEFDYSQLELRLGTAYANEEGLKQVFLEGRDIFEEMSGELGFNRDDTKRFVYSTQYGASSPRIMHAFSVDKPTAVKMLRHYYNTYPKFKNLSDICKSRVEQNLKLKLWSGRYRHFAYKSEGYKGMNSLIQGGAADIVERIMVRVFEEIDTEDECEMLLQVHDSLTFEIREDLVDDYAPRIKEMMEDVQAVLPEGGDFDVRFAVDAKVWGSK